MAIRLFLADDHPIVLDGLTRVLASNTRYAVVGTAANGDEALQAIRAKTPDVAILDIRMPGKSGIEVAAAILSEGLPTRVVLLTADITDDDTLAAVRLGVHGVVLKQMAKSLLLKCIDKVHAGGRWVEQESMRRAFENFIKREAGPEAVPGSELTTAETRVVELVVTGARNKEIAEQLHLSESTVKNHLHSIYLKLNLESRRQLVEWYEKTRPR
jgi:two-component system, NarL family, nitrate/nitrite response regulator NarL